MKRLLGVAALIGIAVIATSCDFPPPAATVGSVAVSQTSLDTDVVTWTSTKSQPAASCLMDVVSSNATSAITQVASTTPLGDATVSTQLTDTILEYQVGLAAQLSALASRHAKVTQTDTANAKTDLKAIYVSFVGSESGATCAQEGYQTWASLTSAAVLPNGFVDEVVNLQAAREAVARVFGEADFSDSGLESFYSSNPGDFTQICLSALAFSSQAQAQTIRGDIVGGTGGATFAGEAQQYAASSQGQDQGGAIGCGTLGSIAQSDPTLLDPIKALTGLNQVGQPFTVQGQAGPVWVLIEATNHTVIPFDPTTVRLDVLDQTQQTYNSWLSAVLSSADVRLNPRYGQWNVSAGEATLEPPAQPPASVVPSQAADSPQLADSLSGPVSGSTP